MKRLVYPRAAVLFILAALVLSITPLVSAQVSPLPIPGDIGALPQVNKPQINRLSTPLDQLARNINSPRLTRFNGAGTYGLQVANNKVKIMVIASDADSAVSIIGTIELLGGQVTSYWDTWIDAWIPTSDLQLLASHPGVVFIQQPIPVFPLDSSTAPAANAEAAGSGTYVSQGVADLGADAWQNAGYRGSGVKIAILDTFKDYATAQAANELPPNVTTVGPVDCSDPSSCSRHGTAVAEIIHDMAPDASLTLVAPTSSTDMASKIVNMAASGNKIISSSVGYFNLESGDGTGPLSNAINTAYNVYGSMYVQAAGNQAQFHWDGQFADSDNNGWMEYAGPQTEANYFTSQLPVGFDIRAYMRWNAWPITTEDYDMYLVYWDTAAGKWNPVLDSLSNPVGSFNYQSDPSGSGLPPTEFFDYTTTFQAYYAIGIRNYSTTSNHIIDLTVATAPPFYYDVSARSLIDAATSNGAFGVAAVNSASPFALKDYSSRGPAHGSGGTLAAGNAQPRIAAYSNVDTWSYGAGVFNGTSAATPHVSGAAALVWEANPSFTAAQVRSYLESHAVDMGASGYDYLYGAGRLSLGSPPSLPPANTNLIRNGDFSQGTAYWGPYGNLGPALIAAGHLEVYSTPGTPRGVFLQNTQVAIPTNTPIEATVKLGNASAVRKRAMIILHDYTFTDMQVCSFWLPPNASMLSYTIDTFTTHPWTAASFALYPNPGDSDPAIMMDDATLAYHPGGSTTETKCIDPRAPSPTSGADSADLIQNGDFSLTDGNTPAMAQDWGTYGAITWQMNNGVFEFDGGPGPQEGVVLQNTMTATPINTTLEAHFALGNASGVRKRFKVLIHNFDFTDLQVCTFFIEPNTAPQNYMMRTHTTTNWDQTTIAFYAWPADNVPWLQVDNVALYQRPAVGVVGTECYYPGSSMITFAPLQSQLALPTAAASVQSLPPSLEMPGQPLPAQPSQPQAPQHVPDQSDSSSLNAPPPVGVGP